MPNINIKIRNKVAKGEYAVIVCDNSDYTAVFDFDAEWDEYTTKTARFVYGGRYTDVVFSGNECPVPVIQDTRAVTVGVFAGDLHTTTPAYFACVPSILFGNGIPADPTPDVYNQLMELLNKDSGIWYPAVDDAGNMSWTRSMSETEPQPVNIKGPKGDAGADGIGSPGADGKDGVDGKSAYELAQDNGFAGTMQEWLASLVGADGTNGADGNDGISPAVSVTAITGGNRVTITDAEGAKTFDVMDGAQGASGADGKDYVLTDTDKQEIAKTAAGLVDVPSVQPDWNQNDSTQPDYVKNRPFYKGPRSVTVENVTDVALEGFPIFAVGDTVTVNIDGVEHSLVAYDDGGYVAIGDPYSSVENGEGTFGWQIFVGDGKEVRFYAAEAHTVSYLVTAYHTIDQKYLPPPFRPASISYLTFKSPNSFTLKVGDNTKHWDGTLEYFASDKTWTVWDGPSTLSAEANGGEYVLYLRGTGNTVITTGGTACRWVLSGTDIKCIGNIETLLDYATVESGGHPTMANYCYAYMFYGCTSLTQAPALPATTMANYCYQSMFEGCTSLTQAPALPATTLAYGCYQYMFSDCTSLTQAPALPATTMANYCYQRMFYGCTSLTQAPALPATTMANYCYAYMFYGCTSLTQAPALPATTMANYCYQRMFSGCTALKLSNTKTGEYTQEYRIPSSGDGVAATGELDNMFTSTGGTLASTLDINKTYYLSSDNMIVRETEIATLNGYVGSMIDVAIEEYADTAEYIIHSSTEGSTKKFKITVDDSGTITATEVS